MDEALFNVFLSLSRSIAFSCVVFLVLRVNCFKTYRNDFDKTCLHIFTYYFTDPIAVTAVDNASIRFGGYTFFMSASCEITEPVPVT